MATHSSILAWRILWTEDPGGLLSIGLHRDGHDWSNLACMHALEKEMETHSSILAWRISGTEEPGGLPSMGLHRVGHDWSDLAAAAAAVSWNKLEPVSLSSVFHRVFSLFGLLSQIGWLINNRTLYLTVLKAGSLRSGC